MKTLFLDIETTPNMAYVWGLWNQNIAISQLVDHTEMLCFGARWDGQKQVTFRSVHEHGKTAMLEEIHRLLDEADIVIGWNSQSFDIKHIYREFLENGFPPPAPHRDLDLMRVVKQQFRLPSNKLDYVAQLLNVGQKTPHTGFQLWLDCMAGDTKAWKLMRKYQIQDVNLLVDLYDYLKPWIKNGPNIAALQHEVNGCRNCGSNRLERRGEQLSGRGLFQRYRCKDCGTWSRGLKTFTTQLGNI
jgi:uncharacterized protein YprB with RNaseH-like and TPR domain/predicted RNA-binding Zn-ribbon protein involved in translation (DUF1610 family)